MDTKGLQKEFINWCKSKNKLPKSEDETKQLFVAFMKEKHPEEYKKAVENQQKQQTTKALHGAKLNYFKSLKHQCAEDEEIVYYKKGGSVTCGCKKKEQGGEVKKDCGGSAIAKFKMRKGSTGMELAEKKTTKKSFKQSSNQLNNQLNSQKINPNDTIHVNGQIKSLTDKPIKDKNNTYKPLTPEEYKKLKNKDKDRVAEKDAASGRSVQQKCGGKVKKHQEGSVIAKFKALRKGGSLNGVPFMQAGTTREGLLEKKVQDPLPLNPTREEFINFYGLPSNFFELDLNTKHNLFMKAYFQYLKSQQPNNTKKIIIPSELLKEPQFNINDITLVLPPVLFDLSKIRRVKYRQGGNLNRISFYLGGTPELGVRTKKEIDAINESNKNRAKGLFKGIFSGRILPTAENLGNMISSAYSGWVNPETIYLTGEAPNIGGKNLLSLGKPFKIIKGVNYYKNAAGELKTAQEMAKELIAAKKIKPSWFPKERHTDHYIPKNATGIYNELEKAAYEGEQMMKNPFMDWKDFDEMNSINYWKHGGLIKK